MDDSPLREACLLLAAACGQEDENPPGGKPGLTPFWVRIEGIEPVGAGQEERAPSVACAARWHSYSQFLPQPRSAVVTGGYDRVEFEDTDAQVLRQRLPVGSLSRSNSFAT